MTDMLLKNPLQKSKLSVVPSDEKEISEIEPFFICEDLYISIFVLFISIALKSEWKLRPHQEYVKMYAVL